MPDITVIRNAHTVVAYDAASGGHAYLNDADVAFDETGFLHVGGRYEGPFAQEISGRDRMVLPGFVNVHCHSGEEPVSKSLFEDTGTRALWGQAMYEYSSLIEISDDAVQAALTLMLGDLLEGDGYRVVVQVRDTAQAKPKNYRVEFHDEVCGECKRAEYACICDDAGGDKHDH